MGEFRRNSDPWDFKKREIPLRTWSGKVTYKKETHFWTYKDVIRIQKTLSGIIDPNLVEERPDFWTWLAKQLYDAELAMLEKIFPETDGDIVAASFDFVLGIIDFALGNLNDDQVKTRMRNLMNTIASVYNIPFTFDE